MTTKEQAIAQCEQQIKDAQSSMELGKCLASLSQNPDFKKVMIEGYLKNEAIRLVQLKADPSMASAENQAAIIRDIDSIGVIGQYFRTLEVLGIRAERSIADAEQAIAEINEEAED